MRAAYLFGPRDLRLIEAEPDTLGPDEVRIEVALSGICGTDLHRYAGLIYGTPDTGPVPLGHEYSGRVTEVGDRITSIPGGPCYRCLLCRTGRPSLCPNRVSGRRGSWAPSLIVPAGICWQIPDDVPDDLATLTEPLVCAIRAVDRAELHTADRVCIIGAGPIGLLILAVARVSGARTIVVTDPSAYRWALATRLGADLVLDPATTDVLAAIHERTDGLGAEVVFEAVGLLVTMEQAIAVAAPGGMVLNAGVADRDARATFSPPRAVLQGTHHHRLLSAPIRKCLSRSARPASIDGRWPRATGPTPRSAPMPGPVPTHRPTFTPAQLADCERLR